MSETGQYCCHSCFCAIRKMVTANPLALRLSTLEKNYFRLYGSNNAK